MFRKIRDLLFGSEDDVILSSKEAQTLSAREIGKYLISKYRKQYQLVLLLISCFEVFLLIRGLLYFDLSEPRRIGYICCYVSLFIFSVSGFIIVLKSHKDKIVNDFTYRMVYAYGFILCAWSVVLTYLDLMGGHAPIVFMTVAMGVAALAFLSPKIFIVYISVLSIIVSILMGKVGLGVVGRSGSIVNFVIFVIITFIVASRQYNQNMMDLIVLRKLEGLSCHDQLTGLKNRFALQQFLDSNKDLFYFGMFDFDDFKKINDSYGHDFGDECLKKVGEVLVKYYGENVFRFGGDEFVVISSQRKAELIINFGRLNNELLEIYKNAHVQISGGFYYPQGSDEEYNAILSKADDALYQAKANGKEQIVFYE